MLPKFDEKFYEYEINNKVIKYKPWKTKDEKEFLIFQQSTEDESFDKLYDIMVAPCIETTEELTYGEKQMLLIEIRKKSYGEAVEFSFTCGKCKTYNDVQMNISDVVTYKRGEFEPLTFEGIVITLKSPTTSKISDDNLSNVDKDFNTFVNHVDTVTKDGEVYKDFTFAEISEFFEQMPSKMFDYFFREYTKKVEGITYYAEGECINCKTKQNLNISKIPNFFPW